MKIERFEDSIAWQKSRELAKSCYQTLKDIRDYSFRDQFQRASVSIMNNIAEGFERQSNREFAKFLFIAKGSCAEVRSMCYLAFDINYISKEQFDSLSNDSIEISRIIQGLIKSIK